MTKIDELHERRLPPIKVRMPSDLVPVLARYAGRRQEHFLAISLDGAHQILRIKIISVGLLNRTIAHPREVFRPAILDSSAAIILAHNHPSGNTDPSPEDKDLTRRMIEAGKIIGIPILDHLVFSREGYFSFQEAGLI